METAVWVLSAALLALLIGCFASHTRASGRIRSAETEVATLREQMAATDQRVAALTAELNASRAEAQDREQPEETSGFLITRLARREPAAPARGQNPETSDSVSNSVSATERREVVLSAQLANPLIKATAFTHGIRRALSAESRNRIGFEMRREVKRTRRQRKKEMRAAWRAARLRSAEGESR